LKGDAVVNPEDVNEATLAGKVAKLLTVGAPPAVALIADPAKGPAGETDSQSLIILSNGRDCSKK
jgi:hypothetical protein